MAAERKKWLKRVLKVLLVFVVLLVVVNFFFDAFHSWHLGREIARRAQCCDHQRQILAALLAYESDYGSFPPAGVLDKEGKPLHSWRVLIRPFMEDSLYQKFLLDEPWDSLSNKKLLEAKVDSFGCPSSGVEESSKTNYVLVTGPGTVWEGEKPCSLKDITYPDQTLLLIEVAEPVIPWTKPKDLRIDAIDPGLLDAEGNFRTNHTGIVFAAFADGHVEAIPQEKVLEALQKWSQVKQTEKREEEW